MSALFLTNDISYVSSSYYNMGSITNASTTLQVTLGSLLSTDLFWSSPIYLPNFSGSFAPNTLKGFASFDVTVTNKNILGLLIIGTQSRNNSSSQIAQSAAALDLGSATFSNSYTNQNQINFSCGDYLIFQLNLSNSAKSTQSVTIGVNRTSSYFLYDIENNSISCKDFARNRVTLLAKK